MSAPKSKSVPCACVNVRVIEYHHDGYRTSVSEGMYRMRVPIEAIQKTSFNDPEGDFVQETYGLLDESTGLERRIMDSSIRNSFKSKKTYRIEFDKDPGRLSSLELSSMFELHAYQRGGKFDWHTDNAPSSIYVAVACLYQPTDAEGGELMIRVPLSDLHLTNPKKTEDYVTEMNDVRTDVIPMPKYGDPWLMVIFPLHLEHSVSEIISGEKKVFKTFGFPAHYTR